MHRNKEINPRIHQLRTLLDALSWTVEYMIYWLVVWNIVFPYIGKFIIPIDLHIFQRGRSTTNQFMIVYECVYHTASCRSTIPSPFLPHIYSTWGLLREGMRGDRICPILSVAVAIAYTLQMEMKNTL